MKEVDFKFEYANKFGVRILVQLARFRSINEIGTGRLAFVRWRLLSAGFMETVSRNPFRHSCLILEFYHPVREKRALTGGGTKCQNHRNDVGGRQGVSRGS